MRLCSNAHTFETPRPSFPQQRHQPVERVPRLDDVLDQQDVLTRQLGFRIVQQLHGPGGRSRGAVARGDEKIDLERPLDPTHQIAQENEAALEQAHHQQVAVRVLRRDLVPQRARRAQRSSRSSNTIRASLRPPVCFGLSALGNIEPDRRGSRQREVGRAPADPGNPENRFAAGDDGVPAPSPRGTCASISRRRTGRCPTPAQRHQGGLPHDRAKPQPRRADPGGPPSRAQACPEPARPPSSPRTRRTRRALLARPDHRVRRGAASRNTRSCSNAVSAVHPPGSCIRRPGRLAAKTAICRALAGPSTIPARRAAAASNAAAKVGS